MLQTYKRPIFNNNTTQDGIYLFTMHSATWFNGHVMQLNGSHSLSCLPNNHNYDKDFSIWYDKVSLSRYKFWNKKKLSGFLEIVERSTQFQNMLSNKVINIINTIKVSLSAVKRKLIPAQGKVRLSLRLGKQHRHSTPPVSPRTHRTDPHLRPAERRLDTLAEQGVFSNFIAGRHVASVCCYAWQREQESPNCGITWASRKTTASTNCCSVFQGVGPSDGRALQCFAAKQKYRPCFGMAHLVNLSLPYCI